MSLANIRQIFMKVKILMKEVRLGIDTRMKSGEYDNLRFAGKKLVGGYRKNLDLVDGWMDGSTVHFLCGQYTD